MKEVSFDKERERGGRRTSAVAAAFNAVSVRATDNFDRLDALEACGRGGREGRVEKRVGDDERTAVAAAKGAEGRLDGLKATEGRLGTPVGRERRLDTREACA